MAMKLDDVRTAESGLLLSTYERNPLLFERGESVYLIDEKGERYLDLLSGIGVNALGYRHPAIEDAIAGLLALDDSGGDQGNNGNGNGNGNGGGNGNDQGGGNNQGGGGGGQAQNAPPPEPAQIEKGQTPDQVKAAIGNPDKIINLGAKQIYVYKDIKVTFLNGKVSDVQ